MSTHTERCFSRKSSGRYGHGIRLNQVNFMLRLAFGSGQPSHSQTPRPITHSRSSPFSQGRCSVKSVMHS